MTGATETAVATPSVPAGEFSLKSAFDFLEASLSGADEPILNRIEREMVTRVLAASAGNQAQAAERLGMTRTTLRKRIEAFGLKN